MHKIKDKKCKISDFKTTRKTCLWQHESSAHNNIVQTWEESKAKHSEPKETNAETVQAEILTKTISETVYQAANLAQQRSKTQDQVPLCLQSDSEKESTDARSKQTQAVSQDYAKWTFSDFYEVEDKLNNRYRCLLCHRSISQLFNMRGHVNRVHLKIKPQICDQCGYATTSKSALMKHIRNVHDQIKDKKCNKCDYATGYSWCLKAHIINVHNKNKNIKDKKCKVCHYTTHLISYLRKHERRVHNITQTGAAFTKCSTIFLRLFLLQFFSKPIQMHQILPHKEELWKNCRKIVERFCGPPTGRGGRE
jgi:hypothetical protein